jgi:hypothetical protein
VRNVIDEHYQFIEIEKADKSDMWKPASVADSTSAQVFVQLWSDRYCPDLSMFPTQKGSFPVLQLVEAASKPGRAQTVDKVRRSLQFNCEQAGFRAYSFYLGMSISLAEAKRLAQSVKQVYEQILDIYLQQPALSSFLKFIETSRDLFNHLGTPALRLPCVQQLTKTLEPVLLQLQANHFAAQDPRAIGFLTTQFCFSTQAILNRLTVYEQVLLTPYLKFLEEQVCMPWQRICAAAANYPPDSPTLVLLRQLLAVSDDIAHCVHQEATHCYPLYHSRRGVFTHPGVAASMVRDLVMFQSYLGLSVLEQQMLAVERELLPLCQVVLPNVGVKWELVGQVLKLLLQEIQARIEPKERELLSPYTQALQALFTPAPPTDIVWSAEKILWN